jgi:hypothetical protein
MFSEDYRGNLQRFLDEKMGVITENWADCQAEVKAIYTDFNRAIERLEQVLESEQIGRKYTSGKGWERLNKVLLEVEAYYFMNLADEVLDGRKEKFIEGFQKFCGENEQFRESIRASTSDLEKYTTRYRLFGDFINRTFGTDIPMLPLGNNRGFIGIRG